MTTYQPKPRQGIYDPNYDPRPKTVCIGVSLITVETETIIQDGRAVELPVDDDIHYITVDRKLIEVKHESCIKYDVVAELLEAEGYPRRLWKIMHCWECIPEGQHPF
ncbi:MAG: hypothetical protein AAF316_10815 [Cyanobacteria bacterium P01_A01_bin.80]